MKIQLLSDVHLEISHAHASYDEFLVPHTDADVLVMAGDIGHLTKTIPWLESVSQKHGKPVIYVPGNHEYYNGDYDTLHKAIMSRSNNGVVVLDEGVVDIGGVRFIGATLWSDFSSYGAEFSETIMSMAQVYINDFYQIRRSRNKFKPTDSRFYHLRAKKYLKAQLQDCERDGIPAVVVTHFAPSRKSVLPHFEADQLSAYWCNELPQLMGYAKLWCHGHTHHSVDYALGDTRIVTNPRGYAHGNGEGDNPGFRSDFVVEI